MQQISTSLLGQSDVQIMESGEDIATYTDLELHDGMMVTDLLNRRRKTRPEKQDDIVVVLDEWATRDDYDIAETRAMIASKISDNSHKSYNVRGAWWFDTSLFNKHIDAVKDIAINNQITRVDKTDTEYVQRIGETYLPKSAVSRILVYRSA